MEISRREWDGNRSGVLRGGWTLIMRDMESGYTFDIRDRVTNKYLGFDDEIKTKFPILNLMSFDFVVTCEISYE